MKTLILIISAMALGLMGVGCSKSNSATSNNGTVTTTAIPPIVIDPVAPPCLNCDPTQFASGYTGTLTTTIDKMRSYTTIPGNLTALNNPTNIKININLAQSDAGRYGGAITISYLDNGIQHSGVLRAGMGHNQTISGGYDNNRLEADYNYWFTFENKLVFTGFFDDDFGAITVNLTPDIAAGGGNDAEPLSVKYKGEVYFKNSGTVKSTPFRSCWFIYIGAIDCRSNVIQSKTGLAPGDGAGYTLLGTFTNVDIKQAFNIN